MRRTVSDTASHDDYSLGNGESELSRLVMQSSFLKGAADLLLDRMGMSAGWRALDMGCGPLGALPSFAERAGPGNVMGLERDPGFAREAKRLLAERGFDAVQLVQGDAVRTGLVAERFDLVHERTLLINSSRPSEVVAEMVRLARPGGYVALQDFDIAGSLCIPAHPDYDRLMSAAAKVWSGDMFIGRRLAPLLSAAGLLDIDVDVHAYVLGAGTPTTIKFPISSSCTVIGSSGPTFLGPANLRPHCGAFGSISKLLPRDFSMAPCSRPGVASLAEPCVRAVAERI